MIKREMSKAGKVTGLLINDAGKKSNNHSSSHT